MKEKHIGRLLSKFKRDTTPRPNLLINGDFQIAQRGAGPFTSATDPINNNDTYLLDQWVFLANGSDTCDVSRSTSTVPVGAWSAIKLDVATANRKFGIANFIESTVAQPLQDQIVSLSFQAKVTGSSINNIRAAVISWQGTVDVVTSSIVTSWNASGSDPTLAATWTYENIPSNLAVSTSYQTFRIENIAIDTASTKNVGVFIWVDDTDAIFADVLWVGNVKLELGTNATDFIHHLPGAELTECQRFLFVINSLAVDNAIANGACASTTTASFTIHLPITMRTSPSVTIGTAGSDFEIFHAATETVVSSLATSSFGNNRNMLSLSAITAAVLTTGRAATLQAATTNAFIVASAEL